MKIPRGAAAVKGSLYKNVTGNSKSGKAVQTVNLSQNTCLRRCFRYFTRVWREAESEKGKDGPFLYKNTETVIFVYRKEVIFLV